MNLILDASVAAKWLFEEPDAERARSLLVASEQRRLKLLAPEILPAEIGSFLWKRVLRGILEAEEAMRHYARFLRVCPALVRISSLAYPALKLALAHRHSIYDSLYVALAASAGFDFVTADERLFRAFAPSFPQVRLLREWS